MKLQIFGLLLIAVILAILATMTGTVDINGVGSSGESAPVSIPLDGDNSFKDLKIN